MIFKASVATKNKSSKYLCISSHRSQCPKRAIKNLTKVDTIQPKVLFLHYYFEIFEIFWKFKNFYRGNFKEWTPKPVKWTKKIVSNQDFFRKPILNKALEIRRAIASNNDGRNIWTEDLRIWCSDIVKCTYLYDCNAAAVASW